MIPAKPIIIVEVGVKSGYKEATPKQKRYIEWLSCRIT